MVACSIYPCSLLMLAKLLSESAWLGLNLQGKNWQKFYFHKRITQMLNKAHISKKMLLGKCFYFFCENTQKATLSFRLITYFHMKAYTVLLCLECYVAICNWCYSYHIAFKSKEKKWKYEEKVRT